MHILHDLLTTLDRRTLAKIEKKVTEKSRQVLYLRLLHSKNDNDTITARKADLARILGVFNVRSVAFTWLSLIVPFQAELVLNTDVIVSETHRDASKIWKTIGGRVYSVSASCFQSVDNRRMLTVA